MSAVAMKTLRLSITVPIALAVLGCPIRPNISSKPIVASLEPQHGSNSVQQVMAAQVPLVHFADQLSNSAGATESLGGIRIHVERKALDLWWKGPLGEAQRALLQQAAREGIKNEVGVAKYSRAELMAAIQRYVGSGQAPPNGLVYLAPSVDARGVEVGVTAEFDVGLLNLGVDAFTVKTSPIRNLSRAVDSPAWWGGAVVTGVGLGSGACTSGFAVSWAWSIDRTSGEGILTADHCAPGGGVPFNNGAGSRIGMAFPKPRGQSITLDALLIHTSNPPPDPGHQSVSARIYDGGVGIGEFSKPVAGSTSVHPGMSICHSGAVSGATCGLKVSKIKVSTFVGFGFSQAVALTEFVPFTAARPGDSGGPVFTLTTDPSKVSAAGILVGVSDDCTTPTSCSQSMAFVELVEVLGWFRVSLMTAP